MESCVATLAIVFTIQLTRWKMQQRIMNIGKIENAAAIYQFSQFIGLSATIMT